MSTPYGYFLTDFKKMRRLTIIALFMIKETYALVPWDLDLPAMEYDHDPEMFWGSPSRHVNGTDMPDWTQTPDYRIKEDPWKAYDASYMYRERERPYRLSPHYKQMYRWKKTHKWFVEFENPDGPDNLGCYCCTVYKKYIPLAGCAVLTPRHVLTTATSTELVIRDRHNDKTLHNILGLWYDIDEQVWNSSMYAEPCRIHYHPRYQRVENVNITHPLPVVYDLALWATTYPLYYAAKTCKRANSGWYNYASSQPVWSDIIIVVGFQYVKSLRKRPMPFFKYATRTNNWIIPCPKQGWGWYHCLQGSLWAKYGVDSGAAWHRATHSISGMADGLAGMCSFSLKLRSEDLVHYFTVINTHPVLDFLYDSYMGRLPYEYLDQRFHDNQWRAPRPKTWYYVYWHYQYGTGFYYEKTLPFYK